MSTYVKYYNLEKKILNSFKNWNIVKI